MTGHTRRGDRAGITLTEILISILIMGIGLTAVASLFPLGLLRIRAAARDSRSTLLAETALSEIASRNLLGRESFQLSWYRNVGTPPVVSYDPLTQDPNFLSAAPGNFLPSNPTRGVQTPAGTPGPGLPICYDPLFWSTIHYNDEIHPRSSPPTGSPRVGFEARFGSGIGFLRDDPTGGPPSAHGLQRITNFLPAEPARPGGDMFDANGNGDPYDNLEQYWPFSYTMPDGTNPDTGPDLPGEIFASTDDVLLQEEGNADAASGVGSPLAPDLSTGSVVRDYDFSWLFTGQQAGAGDYSVYDGSIVVFHKRGFGYDLTNTPLLGQRRVPAGERTVEAVFAWSTTVPAGGGYSLGDDRTVLLRWRADTPDPSVRPGEWIADVTYERVQSVAVGDNDPFTPTGPSPFNGGVGRFSDPAVLNYPGQRCYWYQVTQSGEVQTDPGFSGDPGNVPYRRRVVRIATPVRAKSLLLADGRGSPVHVNAALLNPYIVNVFPKVIYGR